MHAVNNVVLVKYSINKSLNLYQEAKLYKYLVLRK